MAITYCPSCGNFLQGEVLNLQPEPRNTATHLTDLDAVELVEGGLRCSCPTCPYVYKMTKTVRAP